jgi:ribosomal protein S1
MLERRKHPRMRALKGAQLVVGKSIVLDCIVRNLTDQGARIEISNTVGLPDRLQLSFDNGGLERVCRIVWRKLTEAGVEFAKTGRLFG